MSALCDRPTGYQLGQEIRREAHRRNMSLKDFCAPLAAIPASWVHNLETKGRPRPQTVERVRALIAGAHVPEPPRRVRRHADLDVGHGKIEVPETARPVTVRSPDPCFHCGTRGGLACAHRPDEGAPL